MGSLHLITQDISSGLVNAPPLEQADERATIRNKETRKMILLLATLTCAEASQIIGRIHRADFDNMPPVIQQELRDEVKRAAPNCDFEDYSNGNV